MCVLPELTPEGELPPAVHLSDWREFETRFCRSSKDARAIFDSVRAKLAFGSDVFWARASLGNEMIDLWLDTYQVSRNFRRRRIVELVLT